jgi:hypothetical protein
MLYHCFPVRPFEKEKTKKESPGLYLSRGSNLATSVPRESWRGGRGVDGGGGGGGDEWER